MPEFIIHQDGVRRVVDDAAAGFCPWRPPVGTRVVQLLPLGERVIVREDYYHFPRARSNVYCLDASLDEVWSAERRSPSDVYSGMFEPVNGRLPLYSWEGFDCEVDVDTGRLLRSVFTK